MAAEETLLLLRTAAHEQQQVPVARIGLEHGQFHRITYSLVPAELEELACAVVLDVDGEVIAGGGGLEFKPCPQRGELRFDVVCIHTILGCGLARAGRKILIVLAASRIRITRSGL